MKVGLKHKVWFVYTLLLVMVFFSANGQGRIWNLTDFGGKVGLEGLYRYQNIDRPYLKDQQFSQFYLGDIELNAGSYIWHPSFLQMDLDLKYSLGSDRRDYIVVTDEAEVRTIKGIRFQSYFFKSRPVSALFYVDLNENYSNRENLSNIRSVQKGLGANLNINSKYFPLFFRYTNSNNEQKEISTGRLYHLDRNDLSVSTGQSFTKRDKTNISVSFKNYQRQDNWMFQTHSDLFDARMVNEFAFDPLKKYMFRSNIYKSNQEGDVNYNMLNIIESLDLRFHEKLNLRANYNYLEQLQNESEAFINRWNGAVNHQLYLSLFTTVFGEYYTNSHSDYEEEVLEYGTNVKYTKILPLDGRLNINYNIQKRSLKSEGPEALIPIVNEQQQLSDGEITLLDELYADINSVVVKDLSSTVIYQPGIDYLLFEREQTVEIQRVPGGQIANNAVVFIDYNTYRPGNFSYDSNNQSFSVEANIFKRAISVYYRYRDNHFDNVNSIDINTLKYIYETTYGIRLDAGIVGGGAEFQEHSSNITPYIMQRYYINMNKNLLKKLSISVLGSYQCFEMKQEMTHRYYTNFSTYLSYLLRSNAELKLHGSVFSQQGKEMDMQSLNARLEYIMTLRKLRINGGLEWYDRLYLEDRNSMIGVFVKLVRHF